MLQIYKYIIKIQLMRNAQLPEYKGSMFRGAFGWAFRNAVCITKQKTCDNCILKNQCSYFGIFETELPANKLSILRGIKKLPHPMIIHPPLTWNRTFETGAELEIGITLFGEYSEYFPFVLYAFQQMGKSGIGASRVPFEVLSVYNIDGSNESAKIFDSKDNILKGQYAPIEINSDIENYSNTKTIKISFKTPARIQADSVILSNKAKVNYELLLRSAFRRYKILETLFGLPNKDDNYDEPKDFETVKTVENMLDFHDWERYSNRQERKIEMGGFLGNIIFTGEFNNYLGYLIACEHLHIGKNTVFGLGKYKMEVF